MGVIEIKHLTRDYGHGKGVFDISFDVNRGEVFGFLGPNGAGKTTTIRHLVGFIKNQSGTCTINGHDCWKESAYINKHLGYIPGEMAFFDDMTGHEFLGFMTKYRGHVDMRRQQELIELFELNPQGKIKKMSKGMKHMQKHFIELIAKEKEKGKTILLSSHIFEEVERTCDRVGIIRQGKMVTVDSIEILRKRHMHQYTVTLPSNQEAEAFARDFDGIVEGNKVHVTSTSSLEHIFMDYYQGDQ